MQPDREKDGPKQFHLETVVKRATKLSGHLFVHSVAAALSEEGQIAVRELSAQRNDRRHLPWQIEEFGELRAVSDKRGVFEIPVATDQKPVSPIAPHLGKVKLRQQRGTVVL